MKDKIISFKSVVFLFFFTFFFITPHFFHFFNQGVIIPGDIFFYEGNFINSFDNLIIYIQENYFRSLNLFKNPIFIFFIIGAIFQKIIKEI
tara:strand:+ start:200 stop:472 length:273 start_codon:yes stop_codon:yes gene_type:complete